MGYAEYMRALLLPLGIYDLTETSLSGAELEAAGEAFDRTEETLEDIHRESILETAGEEGLSKLEALLSRIPAAPNLKRRRNALRALLAIREGDFTEAAVNRAIAGCGILASALPHETERETVVVTFPEVCGEPSGFQSIKAIIDEIIPCHLEIEYRFLFLSWTRFEALYPTFVALEATGFTWEDIEKTMTLTEED